MTTKNPIPKHVAAAAILALAEIKSAAEAFDRGEISVFDALNLVAAAVEGHRSAARSLPKAA